MGCNPGGGAVREAPPNSLSPIANIQQSPESEYDLSSAIRSFEWIT